MEDDSDIPIYRTGNPFQLRMYEHLARYNARRGQSVFGSTSRGNRYAHLLPIEDARRNFLDNDRIFSAVKRRFGSHKAGDIDRALTNTASSQPFCFNLFVPLAVNLELASRVFGALLSRAVTVAHIEIEFTPNAVNGPPRFERSADESLGDQGGSAGTDADVAIFFASESGRREVLLIETKLIEEGFSACGSYGKKAGCKARCSGSGFYGEMVERRAADERGRPLCGYLRFANWRLTEASRAVDLQRVRAALACPFRFSGQQLWRNMLLAEHVARSRGLEDFSFWVVSPRENVELWRDPAGEVEHEFRRVLTPLGDARFRRVMVEDLLAVLRPIVAGTADAAWAEAFAEKYLMPPA